MVKAKSVLTAKAVTQETTANIPLLANSPDTSQPMETEQVVLQVAHAAPTKKNRQPATNTCSRSLSGTRTKDGKGTGQTAVTKLATGKAGTVA